MSELKELFESIFAVNMTISSLNGKIIFDEKANDYIEFVGAQGLLTDSEIKAVSWVSGSWFMFQYLHTDL